MDPITGILVGASLLGGIISSTGGRKVISPEWLKEHFGPQMVNDETMDLFNRVLNSPSGQQAISQAAQVGGQMQNEIESRAAGAGMGPAGGAQSGSSIFSEAAGGSAAQHAVGNVRADLWNQSFNAAQQMVQNRMGAYLGQPALSQPTSQQMLGQAIGNAAGVGLTAQQMAGDSGAKKSKTDTGTASPTSVNILAPPTQSTAPNLGAMDSTPLASAENPRGLMGRRIPSRIDRFTGRSMSVIQPSLGAATA